MVRGIGACDVVLFVLVKRSTLFIPHATTSQILFTYKAALNTILYAVFVFQLQQMLILLLVSDDPL
jgi:hypothetical protein